MALRITLVTGETHQVTFAADDETTRAHELMDRDDPEWVKVTEASWVRRSAIVRVEIVDVTDRTAGFS
jgi:hypothetical protein